MGRNIKVEICVDSLQSVIAIHKVSEEFGHAVPWRLELCSNLIAGGSLTPSIGLLRACRAAYPELEVMVMIRPRIGPFIYTESELSVMSSDIEAFSAEGVQGFVFGCLNDQGGLDEEAMKQLIHMCDPPNVTFHRAFDLIPGWETAFEQLASTSGVNRILTSGHADNVVNGSGRLEDLLHKCSTLRGTGSIQVLPGSGINADMLPDFLAQLTALTEIHLSASEASSRFSGPTVVRGEELGFGDGRVWGVNEDKLRRVFRIVRDLQDA